MYMSPLILLVLEPEIPGDADLAVGLATYCVLGAAILSRRCCTDPWRIYHTVRIGGTSTCWIPFLAWMEALILAAAAAVARVSSLIQKDRRIDLPAAAAGSKEGFFPSPAPDVFCESRGSGLRLRLVSECRLVGERERRSNRDDRFASGSV